MANVLDRNFDFATNGTVTAAGLHNLIDETNIYAGLISTQEEKTTVGTSDLLLVADSSSIGSPQIAANRTTVYNLFDDALTGGTYANAQLSGNLTYGTATGNRTISTSANITTGTIPNLTAGTTTSTLGTITNLSSGTTNSTSVIATSGTIGTFNSTTGTIVGLNSTTGTIATLNSTTGTIGNLSTTLAGDFTISQGTGTLGTTAVTAGSYGSVSAIPFITVDAKGRVTNATTGTFSTTPADGSITFAKLSTSTTEADNVAKRTTKAWVNFNGTGTVAIRDDFNVSSITDNNTGDYTVNFSASLADANYCFSLGCQVDSANAAFNYFLGASATSGNIDTKSTSQLKLRSLAFAGGPVDAAQLNVVIFL